MITCEPCGCRHDGHKWLAMCDPHRLEFTERHERAQAEKSAADLAGTYLTEETCDLV